MSFFAFGDTLAGLLYQTGRFTDVDTLYVWALLVGSGVGLVASTSGRLCSSAFYALRDTRTPLGLPLSGSFSRSFLAMCSRFPFQSLLRLDPSWGLAGLPASAGVAGWIEYLLLRGFVAQAGRALFGSRDASRATLERCGYLRGSRLPAQTLAEWASAGRRHGHSTLLRSALPRNDLVMADSRSQRHDRTPEAHVVWTFQEDDAARRGCAEGVCR